LGAATPDTPNIALQRASIAAEFYPDAIEERPAAGYSATTDRTDCPTLRDRLDRKAAASNRVAS